MVLHVGRIRWPEGRKFIIVVDDAMSKMREDVSEEVRRGEPRLLRPLSDHCVGNSSVTSPSVSLVLLPKTFFVHLISGTVSKEKFAWWEH